MDERPFRIAVIGGGIGGLFFAISLGKFAPNGGSRLNVDIYESTASLEAQVGAGIGLWPYTWGILESFGIDKELAECTGITVSDDPQPFFNIKKSDEVGGQELFTLQSKGGALITFKRTDLQSVLLRHVPSSFAIHTKKRLRTYTRSRNEMLLHFEDGTHALCDLIIGADGLQSSVRRIMIQEMTNQDRIRSAGSIEEGRQRDYSQRLFDPYWNGSIAYRGLIPAQKLIKAGWAHHRVFKENLLDIGRNGNIMSYLTARGTMINFVAFKAWPNLEGSIYHDSVATEMLRSELSSQSVSTKELSEDKHLATHIIEDDDPWSENGGGGLISRGRARWVCKVQRQEVKDAFGGWEPDMQVLIDLLETPLRWAVHAVHPLPTFRYGAACLVGDSAHAMVPHLGFGAGQAISDSFVLAQLIARAMEDPLDDIRTQLDALLEAYDRVRRPIAQRVAEMSKKNGYHWTLLSQDPEGRLGEVDINSEQGRTELRRSMEQYWSMCWDKQGPFEEASSAISLFRRLLASQPKTAQHRL